MKKEFIWWLLILGIAVFVGGCNVTAPTSTSFSQPSDVTLRGTVYESNETDFDWFIIGAKRDPVANAVVRIDGSAGTYTATTNSEGEYVFTGIPDGNYRLTATAEGYSYDSGWQESIKPIELRAADNTIVTQDILIYVYPIVTGFAPTPDSVILNNQVFTITFNEPMDPSSVRVQLVPQGIRASASDGGDTVQVDLTWSSDSKEVTVIPNGNLISNEVYRLQLAPPVLLLPPDINYPPYDSEGNSIYWAIWWNIPENADGSIGYFADYRTETGGLPGAPSDLQVVINDKPTSEVDFVDVITGTNKVRLNWSSSSSGQITGYKIYAASSGSVNNYVPLEADSSTSNSTTNNYFTSDLNKVIKALYGTGAQVDPISTQNYPFVNNTVYFKVAAYNGDGESGGVAVSARDAQGPQLNSNVQAAAYTGGVLANNYYLPALSGNQNVYIAFQEPIDATSINKNNFSIPGVAISSVTLMINASVDLGLLGGNDYSILLVETDTDLTAGGPRTLTVSSVKDLAGNPVVSGTGDTVIIP